MKLENRYIKQTRFLLLILIVPIYFSCQKDNMSPTFYPTEGINIIIGNQAKINSDQIEYYDHSSKLIYLFENLDNVYQYYDESKFWITDNKSIVFEGALRINCPCNVDTSIKTELHIGSPDYTMELIRSQANPRYYCCGEDERENELFISTLKEYGKFMNGLSVDFETIKRIDWNHIQVTLKITNLDTINYYIPNPEKMELGLYHYLTQGLEFGIPNTCTFFYNNIKSISPNNSWFWDKEWLSIVESGEDFYYTIDYTNFDSIAPGEYYAKFIFPGLRNQIRDRAELQLEDGRIWLGSIGIKKKVTLE